MDIKETVIGDKYLVITESKKTDDGKFDRHSIMVFNEDIEKFAFALIKTTLKF